MASMIVGLGTVEVITVDDGEVEVYPLEPPEVIGGELSACGVRSPVAIGAAYLDADDLLDLVVADPCQNWIALSRRGERLAPARSPAFEQVPAYLYIEPVAHGVVAIAADPVLSLVGAAGTEILPDSLPVRVTRLFVASGGSAAERELVVQRNEYLLLIPVDDAGELRRDREVRLSQRYERPYLRPFSAYDQLTEIQLSGCESSALGIPLLRDGSGPLPRRLHALVLGQEAAARTEYSTVELSVPPEVLTFAVANTTNDPSVRQVVGVVRRDGDTHVFSLLGRSRCDVWTELAQMEIDFDIATPPSPGWGSVKMVPRTDHIMLIARVDKTGSNVEFYHYDGYAVRIVRALYDGAWKLEQRVVRIHETRTDLTIGQGAPGESER